MSHCPLCHKALMPQASLSPVFPFCSRICAAMDLGVWLRGEYVLPGEERVEDPALLSQCFDADGVSLEEEI